MLDTVMQKSDSFGWTATSETKLGDVAADKHEPAGDRVIRFRTYNVRGVATTTVLVFIRRPSPFGGVTETTAIFGDYYKRVAICPCKRGTEKAIQDAHATAQAFFQEAITEAKAFYETKQQAAA